MVTTKPNQRNSNFENHKYHIITIRMHEKVTVQSSSKYLMPAGDKLTLLYQNPFLISQVIIRFQCISFAVKSRAQETCFVPYSRLRCSKSYVEDEEEISSTSSIVSIVFPSSSSSL